MISEKTVKSYCCEDPSLIENYYKAVNDPKTKWVCHHRLETDLDISVDELIERNLYLHRPASELIFLTPSDHCALHNKFRIGERGGMYGKSLNDILTKTEITEWRRKIGISSKQRNKGAGNPRFNRPYYWLTNGIEKIQVYKDEPERLKYYLDLGYQRGMKFKNTTE